MRTHYGNLHITETAGLEVIKAAYRALAQKWHPDKNLDQREKAERVFKIITRAYEVLSDPALRRKYDDWLKEQRSAEPDEREPEVASEPPTKNQGERTSQAWADGKRSREQGFSYSDCPHDGDFADAWRAGFNAGQKDPEQAKHKAPQPAINERYPWRRFFARFLDTLTLGFFSTFVVSYLTVFFFSIDLNTYWSDSLLPWIAIGLAGLIIIEAILIYQFSTTPGKWIFGIRVYATNGTWLSFHNSFKRAFFVQIVGQGACIPGLGLITYPLAYYRLNKTGSTFWDGKAKSRVECAPMSMGRLVACVLVTLVAITTNNFMLKAQINDLAKSSLSQYKAEKAAVTDPLKNYQPPVQTQRFDPSTAVQSPSEEFDKKKWLESVRHLERAIASGEIEVIHGTYKSQPPGDGGAWPKKEIQQMDQYFTWWSYSNEGFYVRVSNNSVYSIKTILFELSSLSCGDVERSKSNYYYYVSLDKSIMPNETKIINFPPNSLPLAKGTNCLNIVSLWDQQRPKTTNMSLSENIRFQNSAPITSEMADAILGSSPARSGSSSPPGCVFSRVMDDEDYKACGITPPSPR